MALAGGWDDFSVDDADVCELILMSEEVDANAGRQRSNKRPTDFDVAVSPDVIHLVFEPFGILKSFV